MAPLPVRWSLDRQRGAFTFPRSSRNAPKTYRGPLAATSAIRPRKIRFAFGGAIAPKASDGHTARGGQRKSRGWPQASPAVPIADVAWLIPPRKPRSLQQWLARKPALLRQIELE
jgi:hypothetical protein